MPRQLTDEEQTRHRLEILNQFFRGMLLLNGGGCVALLAFLQAIWNNANASFVRGILIGMLAFIFGLVFTVVGQFIRYVTSLGLQFGHWYGRQAQIAYRCLYSSPCSRSSSARYGSSVRSGMSQSTFLLLDLPLRSISASA